MKRIELANRLLGLRCVTSKVEFRERFKQIGAVLAGGIVAVFFLAQASAAQELPMVGNCTPGEAQCQVNEVAVCECHEEWRETPEGDTMVVAVCGWTFTGESCGGPATAPDCTPSRRGAEVRFAGGEIKTCRCYGEDNCAWE